MANHAALEDVKLSIPDRARLDLPQERGGTVDVCLGQGSAQGIDQEGVIS